VVEILKQPQYQPVPVERQVVAIWVGTGGHLDDLPVEDAKRFVDGFIERLASGTKVLDSIRESGEISEETESTLRQALADFAQAFVPTGIDQADAGVTGGPRDALREDVGWDRLSSHGDDEEVPGE
jgi:F-type H+-transporting ATPase subunit alpha